MGLTRRTALAWACLASVPLLGGRSRAAAGAVIEVVGEEDATMGLLRFAGRQYRCALGRSGIVAEKREGDGGTPEGNYPLRELRYRPDVFPSPPRTLLPEIATRPDDGWCDEPADPSYNRIVRLPYPADAEKMWREDHLYDALAVIGYNDDPPVPGRGSAIFLHVARPGERENILKPTVGCVALPMGDLLAVLSLCSNATRIDIRRT